MANESATPEHSKLSAGMNRPAPQINPQTGQVVSGGEEITPPAAGFPDVERSFWQHPWVQTVLPFVTSLTVHLSLILIGVVFFIGAKYVQKKALHQEEIIIPAASMINDGAPGGIPFQGLAN